MEQDFGNLSFFGEAPPGNLSFDITSLYGNWTSNKSPFETFVTNVHIFGMPLLILVGCLGNSLSLVVFLGTHLKFQSSSVYLAFLNVMDTVFLVCLFVIWLERTNHPILHNEGVCHVVMYLSYVSAFLSVWTVVAFTAERFIVVFHPLKRHDWCTRKRACRVICALSAGAAAFYSFLLWTMGIIGEVEGMKFCAYQPKYKRMMKVFNTIDAVITFVVPSVTIIILNIAIAVKVWEFVYRRNKRLSKQTKTLPEMSEPKSSEVRKAVLMYHGRDVAGEMVEFNPRAGGSGENAKPSSAKSRSKSTDSSSSTRPPPNTETRGNPSGKKPRGTVVTRPAKPRVTLQLRTTRALVIISSVFLLLNLPSHAFRVYVVYVYLVNTRYILPREVMRWQNLCQIIYYLNFALNFFLYCACSRTFRHGLVRLGLKVKRWVCKPRQQHCARLLSKFRFDRGREHTENMECLQQEREFDNRYIFERNKS